MKMHVVACSVGVWGRNADSLKECLFAMMGRLMHVVAREDTDVNAVHGKTVGNYVL